jgi:hypothetical protein
VESLWRVLVGASAQNVQQLDPDATDAAMKLMAIADEASVGIGFVDPRPTAVGLVLLEAHLAKLKNPKASVLFPAFPHSVCVMVPPSEACVQPKAKTSQVGCTLRSLSHHLALLPPIGEIRTWWQFAVSRDMEQEPLNLLLVPFPYRIDGNSFLGENCDSATGFFRMRQDWLAHGRRRLSASQVASFLASLVQRASNEVRKVHGLVLPEGALDADQVAGIASRLARMTGLDIFICGALRTSKAEPENQVSAFLLKKRRILTQWYQHKHHRWRLDGDQIRRYHLGDALDTRRIWWEKITLKPRECWFYVFRDGASLCALVCEDLARLDPVQGVVRSVGPNLVVVPLMDGPQLERRWPGKYATVLADDPGSAVLTLTCFGMVRRADMPGEEDRREIALWKEPGGAARELRLPRGAHALLVTLSQTWEENFTLDRRSDREGTIRLSLTGVRAIRAPDLGRWVDAET